MEFTKQEILERVYHMLKRYEIEVVNGTSGFGVGYQCEQLLIEFEHKKAYVYYGGTLVGDVDADTVTSYMSQIELEKQKVKDHYNFENFKKLLEPSVKVKGYY